MEMEPPCDPASFAGESPGPGRFRSAKEVQLEPHFLPDRRSERNEEAFAGFGIGFPLTRAHHLGIWHGGGLN